MSEGIFSTRERIEYDFEDGGALTIESRPSRSNETLFRFIEGWLMFGSIVALLPGVRVTPGNIPPLGAVAIYFVLFVLSAWARKSRTRVRIRAADHSVLRQWFFGSFEISNFTLRYRVSPDAPVQIALATKQAENRVLHSVWLLPQGRSSRQELLTFSELDDAEYCAEAIAELLHLSVDNRANSTSNPADGVGGDGGNADSSGGCDGD